MTTRLCLLALVLTAPLVAQGPRFEVASIKRNTTGDATGFATPQPGRFVVSNIPLRFLIQRIYRLQPFELIGGDGWLDSERWDITATIPAGGQAQAEAMLRALVEERFGLVTHRETRDGAVFHLVMARDDRRLGPKMKPAAADCDASGRPRTAPVAGGRQRFPEGLAKGEITGCRSMRTPGWLLAAGQPMSAVATMLTSALGRPVSDRTGLVGNYDFGLAYRPDDERVLNTPVPDGFPPIDANASTLFGALQEQLGLKLEAARATIDVVIIDRVQRPTEN